MPTTPDALLRDYRRKRDFTKTAEPSGEAVKARGKAKAKVEPLRFVVQKHDATRLHYDFRLELDGVLKSWAVTKGPSSDPADKRLAVRVEDHPLEYGGFEGTIPEDQYGGGTVMLWDEGTWEPIGDPHKGLADGDLKFRLDGKRLKGEWVLVHMKGRDAKTRNGPPRENWLLIKHRDEYATAGDDLTDKFTTSVETGRDLDGIAKGQKSRRKATAAEPKAKVWTGGKAVALPEFRPPQLATAVDAVPAGDAWLFEAKYDGYRALAAIAGSEVRLYTRNGNDWTTQFKRLVGPLGKLTKGSVLLDGEVCALKDGHADFSALKDALSTGGDLVYFVFDILELDGENLESLPTIERKERLRAFLESTGGNPAIHFSEHIRGHGEAVFKAMCDAGQEGVVAKRVDAPYRHDRTRNWLKIKCIARQEFVVGGWRPSENKKTFASLLIGTWEDGKLVYRGRVGTGYTAESSALLQAELEQRARKTTPFENVPRDIARHARWVEPELVAEIAYAEITTDGYLRHPSFIGLRQDKPAREVTMELPASVRKSAPEPELAALTDDAGVAVAKRLGVKLTHPEREVYPGDGVTKAKLCAYYDAVAEHMLPHVAYRPLSLVRAPQGAAKHTFFQKHDSGGFPAEFRRIPIEEKDGGTSDYMFIEDVAGLVAGVQMNCLEFHIWGSRINDVDKPDRIIFDIDPDEGLDFAHVREAARHISDKLGAWGLQTFPMLTGGKGIHVIAPLKPTAEWPLIKQFCKAVAQKLEDDEPDRFVANMSKARRKGRMFVDYLRNERGSTAIAPFSTRSRPGAPCAVPIGWDELETLKGANIFSLEEAAARANAPDPWPSYFDLDQAISEATLEAVAGPAKKTRR